MNGKPRAIAISLGSGRSGTAGRVPCKSSIPIRTTLPLLVLTQFLARSPMARFSKVAASDLFKSEPNPAWFGNGANTPGNPGWDAPNWLTSRFHFSFAEHDAGKPRFGVLRVLNDDRVQPARGFGTHGHSNMEIVTYVVEGELTHQDSMGTAETLGRGAIQYMTAGQGVHHSEYNLNKERPLRFIQMWILPRMRGLTPNYGSAVGSAEARRNQFAHLVGDVKGDGKSDAPPAVTINQDANIYVAEITDARTKLNFEVKGGRQAYVVCLEGATEVDHGADACAELTRHDAAEVVGPQALIFSTPKEGYAHVLVLEMAAM